MNDAPLKRHTFSREELDQYFDRISLPKARRIYDVSTLDDDAKLSYLQLLTKHQLCKINWDSLVQHYSFHRTPSVMAPVLFKKIMQPGRGGYCCEVNYLFHLILYTLNFRLYMAGARICKGPGKGFGGWTHVVNRVQIGSTEYLVDGGFGGQGPTYAMPIVDGQIVTQIAPAQMRVVQEQIPDNLTNQKIWTYQHRFNETDSWEGRTMYCFADMEFTPNDISSMNFSPAFNRQSFFTHKVVAVRFSTAREEDGPEGPGSPGEAELEGEINGSITINHDTLKWRRNGEKIREIHFKSEDERVQALKHYYGIELAQEERDAIDHTAAMIGVGAMSQDD